MKPSVRGRSSLTCIGLGELVLHGYDMATAVGSPWRISRHDAELVLYGYRAYLGGLVQPETVRGLTASFAIDLAGRGSFVVRFSAGQYRTEPNASEPADCTIEADPVAFLLAASGRISQWEAIALGAFRPGGPHPALALGFLNLFAYP